MRISDWSSDVCSSDLREDLYFRLNVVNIHPPPLRARPQDIPILAQNFAAKYSEANGLSATLQITPQALEVLRAHHWRGNVRELENTMHRAVLLAQDGRIGPEAIMLTGQSLSQVPQAAEAAGNGSAAAGEPKHLVGRTVARSEEHTSELQSLMRISYAVFCL